MLPSLQLLEPAVYLQEAFLAYCRAFRAANERLPYLAESAEQDFSAYLQKNCDAAQGNNLPPGYVPASTYWLVREGQIIVGSSSLRHQLTPGLEDYGGHIGYMIHPQERRKGYGTLILKLTLEKAREKGISRVLLTCDTDNLGSVGVIRNNGGVLASQAWHAPSGKEISRYWITLEMLPAG